VKEEAAETSHIGTEVHEARVKIAALAERQHGVVAGRA